MAKIYLDSEGYIGRINDKLSMAIVNYESTINAAHFSSPYDFKYYQYLTYLNDSINILRKETILLQEWSHKTITKWEELKHKQINNCLKIETCKITKRSNLVK